MAISSSAASALELLLRHGLVFEVRPDARPRCCFAATISQAVRSPSPSTSRMAPSPTRRDVVTRSTRRSPSSRASALRGGRRPARLPARRLDAHRARAHRRAWRLGALPAALARPLSRPDPERGLHGRAPPARGDHKDRQHARTPTARRGLLAPAPAAARKCSARTPPARATGCSPSTRLRSARRLHARWHALESRGSGARSSPSRRARAGRPLLGTGDHE